MTNENKLIERETEFKFKSIQTSCSRVIDYSGNKNYRTVYRVNEMETLYVDVEWINKCFDEKEWKASVAIALFYIENEHPFLLVQKTEEFIVSKDVNIYRYEIYFKQTELKNFAYKEGKYRIQFVLNGTGILSDEIYLLESHERLQDYLQIVNAGFNRRDEQEDSESFHTYRALNIHGLTGVRLFFVAKNHLPYEWTYEFLVNILDANGIPKLKQMIRGQYYTTDRDGQSLICFAVDLGENLKDFWQKGDYVVEIFCFDKVILVLNLTLGEEDIPYVFTKEIAAFQVDNLSVEKQPAKHSQKEVLTKEEILSPLYQLVGLRNVKEELTRVYELAEFIKMRQANGFADQFSPMNMLFIGNSGTGKYTVACIVGAMLYHLGLLANGSVYRYRREHFMKSGSASEEVLIREALEHSEGGVLLIENAEELYSADNQDDVSIRILSFLLNILDNEHSNAIVILAGNKEGLQEIAAGIPEMKRCFPTQLVFEDYNEEELLEITHQMLDERQFNFTPEAAKKFQQVIKDYCLSANSDFLNAHFIENCLSSITARMAKRLIAKQAESYTKEEMMLIQAEDIVYRHPNREASLKLFDELIVSKALKNSIIIYINYIYFIQERQRHGFADILPPLNMVFAGNPGTGKISVAQMLADILKTSGVLKKSTVSVRTRGEFMGDGSVSPQQLALYVYEEARGGILYLKDAQQLLVDNVGLMILATILSQLSETENGDTIVILSGDSDELTKLLKANPKIKLLFPYLFHFEDYTSEELMNIALQKIQARNYTLHPKAKEALKTLTAQVYKEHDKYFGNALFIEKIVDKVIRNLSARTMKIRKERELTRKEVTTIMAVDIPKVTFKFSDSCKDKFDEKEIIAALKDLDRMVGQQKMKKQIHDFVDLARHYNVQGIKLNTRLSLQWCFTGNSGMGKGTVARIIARLYKAMGVIDKNQVFTFKVERLIGQTEEEAMQSVGNALLEAMGGLFFFDEDSNTLDHVPHLKERVRAMLVNQLAEKPGAYIVIYARQDLPCQILNDEVEQVSDMINVLIFEDYSAGELMEILKRDLASEKFKMTRIAQQYMNGFITNLVKNNQRNHVSARLIKIVAELIVRNCIQRITQKGLKLDDAKIYSVMKQDVVMFTPDFLAGMTQERQVIGFKM